MDEPYHGVLAFMAAALCLALVTACQPGSETPIVSEGADVTEIAMTAHLPYGVDVTGEDASIFSLEADVSLADLLEGKRYAVLGDLPAVSRDERLPGVDCTGNDCRQVQVYNYTDSTTIVATVAVDPGSVLDVHVLPQSSPALGEALGQRVRELVDGAPLVQEQLAGRGWEVTMGPAGTRREEGPCATHWCVMVSLKPGAGKAVEGEAGQDDRLLVFVDLDSEEVVDAFWRSSLRQEVTQ